MDPRLCTRTKLRFGKRRAAIASTYVLVFAEQVCIDVNAVF
jgi:hypothetical protein